MADGPSPISAAPKPANVGPEAKYEQFYSEVKDIEKRDSVLTSTQQIDRLLRPGATYFNLNPFDVLIVDPDTPLAEIKKKYRRMSILVHPDKNPDDRDRSQKAFDAVNKAHTMLNDETEYKRCQQVVEEARTRVLEIMEKSRKEQKKEGKSTEIPEDDPVKYKQAVYVQTCKLFADLERLKQEEQAKLMKERKRKAEEDEREAWANKEKKEWDKNFEESRSGRVDSWRDWAGKKAKKSKGFRPPKPKLEKR